MTPWWKNPDCLLSVGLFALGLVFVVVSQVAVAGNEPPYSCRRLYDEERKCSFAGKNCDRQVVDRLTRECLRDGGRP
jgi:hypothetical protein